MYPIIKPITSQAQLDALINAAKEDGHSPMFPTHEVCSFAGGSTIGYISLMATPVLNFWMHTKNAKARDSWFAFQVAENLARVQGHKSLIVPCTKESPYSKLIEKHSTKMETLYTEILNNPNEQNTINQEILRGQKQQAILSFYND